jgi:hypothetical protein
MVGGVEIGSGLSFLKLVDHRNAATLLPIIQKYVLPGMTSFPTAYGGIANLSQFYVHLTVNHSINFIDPITGAHTQNIESKRQKFKHKIKKYGLNQNENHKITYKSLCGEKHSTRINKFSTISGNKSPCYIHVFVE